MSLQQLKLRREMESKLLCARYNFGVNKSKIHGINPGLTRKLEPEARNLNTA